MYETNEMNTLFSDDREIHASCLKRCQQDQIVWKRPQEFPDAKTHPYVLFREMIEPNDIKQVSQPPHIRYRRFDDSLF